MVKSARREIAPRRAPVPRWALQAGRALAGASIQIRVIAANTPRNLREELDRLGRGFPLRRAEPRFEYERTPLDARLRRTLEDLGDALDAEGALGVVYAARARELAEEAALCEHAGTPGLWAAARRRYARRDRFDTDADALAVTWLDEPEAAAPSPDELPCVRSDDEADPRSLLSRLRREIGRRRLPIRAVVSPNIASLAATGDGFVQVVAARMLSVRDVERTVLHEIEGHVLPRLASARHRLGIFAVGTARGSDDQEGRALLFERAAGFLDRGRRREIALRHLAARSVERGASFVSTADLLVERGAAVPDALRIAARVHRGGGLGREAVYLPALLRVEAALERDRGLDQVLAAGRVSIDAAPVLREWVEG
ncbi:MAG: DUF1704 domain-containing protein [Byssovorax sp.]